LNSQQQTTLVPVCNTNNGYNTVVTHELLEKEVNTVYLNTLAKGILSFDNVQLNTLRLIASYCPQEGGAAVHQARGMLSMVEDVDLLNFDCNARNQAKLADNSNTNIARVNNWEIILYPNPATNELNIQSNVVLPHKTKVEIYNALGQLVKTILLDEESSSVKLSTSGLFSGIYFLQINNGEQKETQSFSISKN